MEAVRTDQYSDRKGITVKRINVEINGKDIGQLYRRLRDIAEQIAQGEKMGVMDDGPDGDYEYDVIDLD